MRQVDQNDASVVMFRNYLEGKRGPDEKIVAHKSGALMLVKKTRLDLLMDVLRGKPRGWEGKN